MQHWPDRGLLDLLAITIPIIQAPMAGSDSVALARSVSSTGALGSLACAMLTPDAVRESMSALRHETTSPYNLNFFCHPMKAPDAAAAERWKTFLRPHYERFNLDIETIAESRLRLPFDEEMCAVVQELKPEVVSFHFGLPTASLVDRLKSRGMKIVSSATSVSEAKWLESRGCDAIIAQGFEAGGHRGMFLETNSASWTVRSAASSQRCSLGSGHCCRWNCRRSGCYCGVRTWRVGCAVGHCVPVLPRGKYFSPSPPGSRTGRGYRNGIDESVQWPPGERHSEPVSSGIGADVRRRTGISLRSNAHCALAGRF